MEVVLTLIKYRVLTVCGDKAVAPFTEWERKTILDYHNELRANVSQGKAKNYKGNLSSAKNMYKLRYDCKMEGKVQAELDKNLVRITFDNGYGQNVARFTKSENRDKDILHALESWSNPVLFYGIKNEENRYDDDRLYTFANMIYAKTLRFGCGYKDEGETVIISCIYNLIGAYPNNILYEEGEMCKKAKDCTMYPASKCEKATGLCKYSGPAPNPG
ncbi:unnamed protein product [Cylicostephanus goldi]|uniref:SCP domain-containing protein n=1 Tax=Cylicostephanus goldi TaxID=71465 RepID=A0A3P6S5U2_CYLGO|nr:unnamed protein product [Cylicostephanus goldi]